MPRAFSVLVVGSGVHLVDASLLNDAAITFGRITGVYTKAAIDLLPIRCIAFGRRFDIT